MLLDDGVIDRGAETFAEDFDAKSLAEAAPYSLAQARVIEGQSLVGIPGKSGFSIFFITARRRFFWNAGSDIYVYIKKEK